MLNIHALTRMERVVKHQHEWKRIMKEQKDRGCHKGEMW